MAQTEAQKRADRRAREKFQAQVRALKESTPCADCGRQYPHYVMQFDHVPERGGKLYEIHTLVWNCASRKFWEEVKKCDLVCSNCHAVRTHVRRQVALGAA